jgi:TPR repeat protein
MTMFLFYNPKVATVRWYSCRFRRRDKQQGWGIIVMNKAITVSTITVCIFILLIAGCVAPHRSVEHSPYAGMAKSVPLGSESTLTPGIAHIHVNRPSAFRGITASTPIKFNGRKVGRLFSGTSFDQFVTPGHLRISSNYMLRPFDLVVKGGHKYLIDVAMSGGKFELVSDVLVAPPQEPDPLTVTQTGPAVAQSNEPNAIRAEPAAIQTDKSVSTSGLTTQETIATTVLAPTTTPAPQTGPQELRGKVIRVDGRLVRIVIESEMWPRVGDTVRLGQTMSGFDELIFMAGEWTVTEVTSEYIQAEASAGASGTPGRDYVAVIRSANPQKRASIAPVEKVSEKKADERFDLALKLWEGRNISQDREKSLQLIQQGVREGHPVSMRALGWIYERGEGGIAQDYTIAVKWYRKAADAGAPNAYNLLGKLYEQGNGVKQSYSDAAKLYEEACNGGVAQGCTNLGYMYRTGKGVKQDYARAIELYEKGCGGGNARGCTNLGYMYDSGQGVKQDYHRAAELYEKACSEGDAHGCGNLGWMFYQGRGVAADQARGRKLMKKACTMGHQWSCDKLKEFGK